MAVGLPTHPSRTPRRRRPLERVSDAEVAQLWELAEKLAGRPLPGVRVTEPQFVERYFHEDLNAEWVDGEVFVMAPANVEHEDLQRWLGTLLTMHVDSNDSGKIFGPETQVRLAKIPSRRNPDLLFIARANLHHLTATSFDGAPDLVMEIVSPDSAARDWRDKYFEYERSGVRDYWLIDPGQRRCEGYSLGRARKYALLRQDDDGRIFSKVLRGLFLRPDWLWQSPRPKLAAVLKQLGVR